MFDSHCHLQDERIEGRVDGIVDAAVRAGVSRVLCCGSREADWDGVARIGAGYRGVVTCAYGVHPLYAGDVGGGCMTKLEEYLTRDPSAAVGEIGLDHFAAPRNDAAQADIFIRQLEIAGRYERPVSIHCRKAWGDLLSILGGVGGLRRGGAIHSYSGPPDLVGELEKLGCYISFSGSITIPGNKRAAESLKKVSPERLLIETDSPDLLPSGAPGPHNEPANITVVINRVAEILGEAPGKVAALTHDNAQRLFAGTGSVAGGLPFFPENKKKTHSIDSA
jgi:TatD DNase family protein